MYPDKAVAKKGRENRQWPMMTQKKVDVNSSW